MRMKPSLARAKPSRSKARNAAFMNQLATPGLGSLMAGHWLAGTGQLLLFLAGFILFCAWSIPLIITYYRMAFSDSPPPPSHAGNLALLGVALCVMSWCWSLVTSLSLMREASSVRLESLKTFAAGQVKMDQFQIISALGALPQWQRNGEVISRTYEFKDFPAAMVFVNDVAQIAEQAQHHPDVDIRWNKVTLALTTHEAGGLTEKDFALARQCDQLSLR
jgi:4a-hydroxytetrahydrobiopterin dehydratase